MTLTFRVQNRQGINNINRIVLKFPKAPEKAVEDFGMSLQRRVRRNITMQKLISTGTLHKKSRWSKKKKAFIMPAYGVELETQRPKSVLVKPNTRLWNWVFLKRNIRMHRGTTRRFPSLENKVRKGEPITLHKYDVFQTPFANTVKDLPKMIKNHTNAVMRSRGRES